MLTCPAIVWWQVAEFQIIYVFQINPISGDPSGMPNLTFEKRAVRLKLWYNYARKTTFVLLDGLTLSDTVRRLPSWRLLKKDERKKNILWVRAKKVNNSNYIKILDLKSQSSYKLKHKTSSMAVSWRARQQTEAAIVIPGEEKTL